MQSFSLTTVCVGKPYIDYFQKIIKSYGNLNLPDSTIVYVNTNHVDYCEEKLKDAPVKVIINDFSSQLDYYKINECDYRDNDCIKVKAFTNALDADINDLLFYVDADMEAHLYDEEMFDKVFDQEGFYYELAHYYEKEEDIEEHTFKRIRQIRELNWKKLSFLKGKEKNVGDEKIIFPIERFWGMKRTFCAKELKFAKEFDDLFEKMIEGGLRNDLYTECVEIGHCFSKFFKKNKMMDQGLMFIETAGPEPGSNKC